MRMTQALRILKVISKTYEQHFKVDLYEQIKEQIRESQSTLKDVLKVWINEIIPVMIEADRDNTILYYFYKDKLQKLIEVI